MNWRVVPNDLSLTLLTLNAQRSTLNALRYNSSDSLNAQRSSLIATTALAATSGMLEAAAAAAGVRKTTLPNSFSLGHQRRELTKVYVPALHHNDNLVPKPDICASDGQPRVMGEIIEWLKTPGQPVEKVFVSLLTVVYQCGVLYQMINNKRMNVFLLFTTPG